MTTGMASSEEATNSFGPVGCDDHADDKQDGHLGHDRQSDRNLLDLLAENSMADHAKSDREQHHIDLH